jgi:hypothetical protein
MAVVRTAGNVGGREGSPASYEISGSESELTVPLRFIRVTVALVREASRACLKTSGKMITCPSVFETSEHLVKNTLLGLISPLSGRKNGRLGGRLQDQRALDGLMCAPNSSRTRFYRVGLY